MLFLYSDIIKHLDNEQIQMFDYDIYYALKQMTSNVIVPRYVNNVVSQPETQIAFYCINQDVFDLANCPTIIVYSICRNDQSIAPQCGGSDKNLAEDELYIHLIATHRKFRQFGYGKLLMTLFMEWVMSESINKVILSSIVDSVTFYEDFGFTWVDKKITEYPQLAKFENLNHEHFIMEYEIKQN